MSLMFNKMNAMYYYFSQSEYTEKYKKMRKTIIENKYNDKIFMSKNEICNKYKKKRSTDNNQHYYDKIPNDIESNLKEVRQAIEAIQDNYEEDNDSVCSHVVIYNPNNDVQYKHSDDDEFCYVSMCDMV